MCYFWWKMCTNQNISNIPFIMRGNHFLVHGHKKDFPHITCISHLLKYVVKYLLVSAILRHFLLLRLLPKSYFKISSFQPNFLCSSSFDYNQNAKVVSEDDSWLWQYFVLVLLLLCFIVYLKQHVSWFCLKIMFGICLHIHVVYLACYNIFVIWHRL